MIFTNSSIIKYDMLERNERVKNKLGWKTRKGIEAYTNQEGEVSS